MADYGLVPRQIDSLANRVGNLGERSRRHEETMGNLQLQGVQFDANMMGLSAERAMKLEQAKQEQYYNEPVTLGQAIQTSKFPDDQKKKLLETIPQDVLMVPTTRKKAFEAYQTLAKEQRDIQQKELDRASREKISLAGQGGKQGAIDKVVDLGDRQRIIYNDGRVDEIQKGASPSSTQKDISELGRTLALQVIDGRLDPNMISKRGGLQQEVFGQIEQISPGFNIVGANANAKFATNSGNLQSRALINGVEPLYDELLKKGEALGNSNIPGLNRVVNWAKLESGDPGITAFNNLRDDVIAESERILMGSGVLSDSKYQRALHNVNSAQSYPQLKAAVDQLRLTVNSRLKALDEKPFQNTRQDSVSSYENPNSQTSAESVGNQQSSQYQQQSEVSAPPVEGAKQAPDGNWYVMQPNGKYARVDME